MIVAANEDDVVVGALNASFDHLEEKYTLFGGGMETVVFEHAGEGRKSALRHTIAAAESVGGALRIARQSVAAALHTVV
ncbi:MAG TPA: hypothetical protein VI320_35605 [Terracidiphilus sp.]